MEAAIENKSAAALDAAIKTHFHERLMDTADILTFLGVYWSIFVEVACIVQLVTWFLAWYERNKEKMTSMESKEVSTSRALEATHGPPAQLPPEPVAEQFLKNSKANPASVALVVRGTDNSRRYELTYESLAGKVHTLAKKLLSVGVGQGEIVLLALDRGVHQIAIIYATMLCRAAWVPVDTAVPEDRLKELLHDSSPSLLVHQEDATGLQIALWGEDVGVRRAIALLDASDLKVLHMASPGRTLTQVRMDDCALVIYTSGTTGKPKGIMYSHAMINHGTHAIADLMQMNQESVAFLKTPYIWAVVEWELFPALVCGGTLVVGTPKVHKEPQNMADTILAERVTSLVMAPDVLDLLLDVHEQGSQLQSLEHVISVGAGLPVALANRFVKTSRLSAKLHNVYGASESSCTVWTVPPNGVDVRSWSNRAPVGVPQMGCSVWILNEDLKQVRTGDAGELCFGGQLALGYFKLPELTAEKFTTHPDLGPIYRTGDLARWREGVLEICGRKDRQVKINGVRVEPEEVESAMKAFSVTDEIKAQGAVGQVPTLQQVACVATTGSSPELVAFVAPTLREAQLNLVKEFLESKLPRYYLPKYFFSRSYLPNLPNGKINLQMLVKEADESVEMSSANVVLDSLGQMRSMSREMIIENQVIKRCYAYWMLGVMIDHWYFCGLVSTGCVWISGGPAGYVVLPWVDTAVTQIGGYQVLFGFMLLGCIQKTRPKPGETKVQLTLGYEDALVLLVYLLVGLRADSEYPVHRWYLGMVVIAHLSIALCQRLRMPGWLQVIGHFTSIHFFPTWFDPCSRAIPRWLEWFCCWIIPFGKPGFCPIVQVRYHQYLALYVFAFYYGRPGMRLVTRAVSRWGCNTAAWAVIACGVSMVTGAALVSFHPSRLVEDYWVYAVWMFQTSLFALSMVWFPFDLSWWGDAALSTYVLHFDFGVPLRKYLMTDLLRWAEEKPGWVQLLSVLVVPLAFMTIVGPLFHHYCLVPAVKMLQGFSVSFSKQDAQEAACSKALSKGSKI